MSKGVVSFVKALSLIKGDTEMHLFLQEILTEAELRDIGLRWELMRQLKAGQTQRSIAKVLGVSLCKVTRGNKILKNESSVARRLLGDE